ncbi:MAG: GGDEF domain-containing protein [Gemmatimonadota bacterium]
MLVAGLTSSDAVLNVHEKPLHKGGSVTPQALLISLLALLVTGVATFVWPDSLSSLSGFVWLLALIPCFLLAYHKGWRGAAVGFAASMVLMVGLQVVVVSFLGNEVDWQLAGGLTVVLIGLSFAIGWVAEALHRRRDVAVDLAYTDELTGLANRRALLYALAHHFAAAKRETQFLCAILFDLDGFKEYNNKYGHSVGDEAMRLVGRVLADNTRNSDLTGRYGGDEFLTLLPGTSLQAATTVSERVLQAISEAVTSTGDRLTMCAGVADFDPAMFEMRDLVAAADLALYEAKSKGSNTIVQCPPQIAPGIRVLDGGA